MKILAIIPARGGSKRIERKNVKPFAGVPVIAYSIRAALRAGCFDEVMVSTDDDEIAEVARRYGAEVPFMRSEATANDYATTADVIREVVESYRKMGKEFDAIACIYATAPFVTDRRLADAAGIITRGEARGAFTCVEYSYPIQRSLVIGDDGRVSMRYPEYATARSQDLRKTYHDAGQFYFSTLRSFEECGSLWGPDTMPIVLPELEVQDLDTPTDWRLAEIKYEMLAFPKRFRLGEYEFLAYPEMTEGMSRAIFDGRNDPEVRVQMVNRDPIRWEDHVSFVDSLSTRRDKQYYAVTDAEGSLVGSVNFEWTAPDTMERGIWIASGARGKGHASRMLRALYDYFADIRGAKNIETRVRRDNAASLALERSLGAEKSCEDGDYIFFVKSL